MRTSHKRKNFNPKLNARIAELGFTNNTLAAAAGVNRLTISNLRNRKHKAHRVVAAAIARALKSSPEALGLVPSPANPKASNRLPITARKEASHALRHS